MRSHPKNPDSNALKAGVKLEDLKAAINKSGYPLQSQVVDTVLETLAEKIRPRVVQEEWSYIDQDEDRVRQLDALLSFEIEPPSETASLGRPLNADAYIRGSLDFLIECKRSDLPFVCFVRSLSDGAFPLVGGLPNQDIRIHQTADDAGHIGMSARDALGVYDLPLSQHDLTANALTKGYRKGKAFELSGEEAFRGLALPILKAASYYLEQVEPHERHLFFDVRTIIPLAVVDAPLMAVHMIEGKPTIEAAPWIRMVRHEPGEQTGHFSHQESSRSFDIVHADFLSEYVENVFDFARELVWRSRTFAQQLLTGHARLNESSFEPTEKDSKKEQAPFEVLRPHFSDQEFEKYLEARWDFSHAPRSDANDEPSIRIKPGIQVSYKLDED